MNITVKYFAGVREQLGKSEECLKLDVAVPVAEIWKNVASSTVAEDVLMAVNMEYVRPDTLVRDGDEVAFFPPVTGG